MKPVLNFSRRLPASIAGAGFLSALVAASLLAFAQPAGADSNFWTKRELLADFFKTSEKVGWRKLDLGPAQRQRIEQRLGYALPRNQASYTLYVAETRGQVDGYALIDDEPGEHLPITFAVKLSPSGAVLRQEIVAYREARGDEVRDPRFRAQFVGKTVRDPLRTGDDVVAVSGATISSRAMATGVRRALILVDELVIHGATPQQPSAITAAR